MSCKSCKTNFNVKGFGTCDLDKVLLNGADRTTLNWTEISVPEILPIPAQKPDIESIDQVYVDAVIKSIKLIETPFSYREYNRTLTASELSAVTATITAINAVVTEIGTIDLAGLVAAIEAIPGIGAIPGVSDLIAIVGNTVDDVLAAVLSLTTAITAATAQLVTGVLACLAVSILETLQSLVTLLQTAIGALEDAITALIDLVNSIDPVVVGPLVEALLNPILAALTTVVTLITTSLTSILNSLNLINSTPSKYFTIIPNAEGTCLSGRKLVIEGVLKQKIVYTGLVDQQSVHSAHYTMPFSAFIIPYAKFEGLEYDQNVTVVDENGNTVVINGFGFNPEDPIVVDLCEEFAVKAYIEDIFAYALDCRTVFKNVTLFLQGKVIKPCAAGPTPPVNNQCEFIIPPTP